MATYEKVEEDHIDEFMYIFILQVVYVSIAHIAMVSIASSIDERLINLSDITTLFFPRARSCLLARLNISSRLMSRSR